MASSITFCCSPEQTSTSRSLNSFTSFNFFLVDAILHHSTNLVIYWLRSGLFGGYRSDEMNAGVSLCSSLIVSRALCAGALFCWNISQGSVATHLRWGGIFINNLLQISNWVRRWKNCENRSIFSKDMDKSIVSPFLTHGVYKGISISLGKAGWRLCWKTRVILMYFNCFYILPLVIGQPSYTL